MNKRKITSKKYRQKPKRVFDVWLRYWETKVMKYNIIVPTRALRLEKILIRK